MKSSVVALAMMVLMVGLLETNLLAQGGDGSLRGLVKDQQDAAMPGVTVTATSPGLLTSRRSAVMMPPGSATSTTSMGTGRLKP